MSFSSLFLFFFGAIGVFNSFLISLYFILRRRQQSNLLFGLFLLFLSERALRSLIYFFSSITPNDYSKFGPITFLFIGPFLLFYVLSVIKPTHKILDYWKHYILFWMAIAISMHLVFPFRADPIFYKAYILKAINIQWLIHILISGVLVYKTVNKIQAKKEKCSFKNIWLYSLIAAVLVLWVIYFFVSFNYFVIGSITFSVLFYSFFLYFNLNKKKYAIIFRNEKRHAIKKIDNSTEAIIVKKLNTLMKEQKLYKNPNLKASEIAQKLNISPHQFSQLLNDNLGKNFAIFINTYRVEEAKLMIMSNTKYTLEAIGNESGFNSKSSFYGYFKKQIGMTPSLYRKQVLSSKL